MSFQRVGSRRVVEIFACLVISGVVGETCAQSNITESSVVEKRLIQTPSVVLTSDASEKVTVAEDRLDQKVRFTSISLNSSNDRPWSTDLNQILMLSRNREDASKYLPSNSRAGVSTNQTAAVFQEPGSTIDDARMDVLMRRIEENGYGTSNYERDRSALSRTVERGVNTLFVPEPIKLGHARLGFSPYTAIKRKNPFCLLNPIPLALSW